MVSDHIRERMARKLEFLYGAKRGAETLNSLLGLIAAHPIPERGEPLSERDVIVIAYGDHLQRAGEPPLRTLHRFLKKRLGDVVSGVHILPFNPYTSDDGFSVVDYRAVNPALGSWDDIARMGQDFRLMFDLVLNHTSVASAWFQGFLSDDPTYREYYLTADPQADLSAVVRPRIHPLLTPFETRAGTRHVWTTFSADQVDLNYANPAVLLEIIDVLLFYVEKGADFIRLDAVAYLWKEIGTSCIHLPQTHAVVQLMRDVLDAAAPWVNLITETNVPHDENISYFGDGLHEAQLVYNFALPPLAVHALQTGYPHALSTWAKDLTTPSARTAFFNFTASHDGIGVRPASGLLSEAEIGRMIETVKRHGGRVSYKTNSDGTQSPYEMNITYFDALSSPDDPQDIAVARFICSQAIMLALGGVPGIYLPGLFGARNWYAGVTLTGHNRAINREKFDADMIERELADPGSLRAQVFSRYVDLLRVRTTHPAFHPNAPQRIIVDFNAPIFAIARVYEDDGGVRVLGLHNASAGEVGVEWIPQPGLRDLITGERWEGRLGPYQVVWLSVG